MGIADDLARDNYLDLSETLLISADSHVTEPEDLWQTRLPAALRDRAPQFPARRQGAGHSEGTLNESRPGGADPDLRLGEMSQDGVSAEVLFPTLGLRLFAMEDARLQEACFRVYNDWLIEYCSVAPDRLFGVALVAAYDMRAAIDEMTRCRNAGMAGAMVWQVPPPELPFSSEHYEPLWAAAQDLDMPIDLHILTGFDYSRNLTGNRGGPLEAHRGSVNLKTAGAMNTVMDIIFTGVLERYPGLTVNVVESEIGWIPFTLQQWDYYVQRFGSTGPDSSRPLPISLLPSEYFAGRCRRRSSMTRSAASCSSGGARTTACGRRTTRTRTRRGRARESFSSATWATCPEPPSTSSCVTTYRASTRLAPPPRWQRSNPSQRRRRRD